MNKSDERIQFIADYISAYEEKIKLLNANGLFDSAKLFELFAIEVGSLYFGQQLSNLNVDTFTYPCVDLISADKQTYIQVSTTKDVPTKIKTTLENIRDSKRAEINTLTNVKFFMLNNDSVDKVKDYTGNNQIGSISFTKANDLITTKDILQKATDNLDFQINLYGLLQRETDSIKENSYKVDEAIKNSKSVGLDNIDCRINNEYEIDRSKLISKIKADNYQNISIQGGAGSGKSVLCKMIVDGEANLIYARAERFQEETDINNIWGFNVRQTLEYFNGKPIVFFIDSLEFIADIRTKFDLLCTLYECVKNYPAAKIITSCRTSDKNAFMKIESNYSVYSYEVPELAKTEQLAIAKKYPIIEKMLEMNSYAELLKSPFYINLIVSKITDIDNISDENQLREYIWQYIICLDNSETMRVVESIVFTRAKDFSLGVTSVNYDTKIIKNLVSKGVLLDNGKTVRLKYDIFEDICFEQYLDNEFYKCKGKYNEFFEEIEAFGRCVFRRYQIWISNKLLAKDNREKFLFQLVFSDEMPQDWRKQTEIGLVKSRYCSQFFSEYGQTIIDNCMLNDFIKITNLYSFEINNSFAKFAPYIQLRPSGEGRASLIDLISVNKLHEKDDILRFGIEKICTDYSKVQLIEKQTAEKACTILEYIVDKYMTECEAKTYHKLDDIINGLLIPIYQMAEYSKRWIKEFWGRLQSYYKGEYQYKLRLAEDIIEETLKMKHIKLAEYLPSELCNLAEMFWTYSPKKNDFGFYARDRHSISYLYGLNERADEYEHGSTRGNATDSNFFFVLFRRNFWIGLNWAIDFVNNAVLYLAESHGYGIKKFEINYIEDNTKKSYLGSPEMWLATTQEYRMPTIISDLLFCLKEELHDVIKNNIAVDKEITENFAENVAKLIFEKSNNIALLTIIAEIGMEFRRELPGFALDLVTNIHFVLFDLTRISLLIKNPIREMLEKQIYMTMGISSPPPDRYNKEDDNQYDLLSYFIDSQLYDSEKIKMKCHKILDYLYTIVPNDKENATGYLQIQKMDLRSAQAVRVDNNTIALIPTVTGEAEKVTIENGKQRQTENELATLVKACNEKLSKNCFKLKDCLESIEQLMSLREKTSISVGYDKLLVSFIAIALKDPFLNNDIRASFCQIWIDGIKSYFSNESFIFEYRSSVILFSQIETEVSNDIKNQIKELIVNLILFKGQHGVVADIARFAKIYLLTNKQLARAVFNTIVKLAEDEMNHQKFNAEHIKKNKKKIYQSKENIIFSEYLFNNTELNLSNLDMNNYDITKLCYAINCGMSLDDDTFAGIVKKILIAMIDVWKANNKTYNTHEILDAYSLCEIMEFFQRELLKNEKQSSIVFYILFTDIDFSKFTHEALEFYLNVFGSLLAAYFDSYSDKIIRAKYVGIIRLLEDKIVAIKEECIKVELYKSLTLSITHYGGAGDWSKCPSGYSYQDKQFLNDLFSKYGGFHLEEMLATIYKLHLDKLLPEILLSVRDAFKNASRTDKFSSNVFAEIVRKQKWIVLTIITKAFLNFSDQIKQDDDLTKAFEEILEMFVEINYEEAATILDEFRVH
ncbi:MAG: hypothetical protein CVU91_01225 [Firmicutes bacterium HGW-Firmicutes-16]|nr:MAG: hypothetical protein CVU91_01225 [Firmicutes bacterium HGW-Firmicutes-16]